MKLYLLLFLLFFYLSTNAQMMTSVYFEHDSYKLNFEAKRKLDSLAQLKASLKFRIFGNCDSSGSDDYNKELSEKRANAVSGYLKGKIQNNIQLISVSGLGEEKPINDNSTEELKAKNRRVDIFIEKIFNGKQKFSRKNLPDFLTTEISQMKVKDTFLLARVSFEGGRHVWLREGRSKVLRLFKLLKENREMKIELQGHICCDYENFDGQDLDLGTFNLSFTRANAIKEFLQNLGIEPHRIKAKGLGHLNPVVYPETSEADRRRNRRVEIVLLEK